MTRWNLWAIAPSTLTCCVVLPAALLFPQGLVTGQRLSSGEEAIVQYLNMAEEEALGLLERVVNINSGTMNHEGVRQVGAIFREELDALGFQTRWIEFPPEVNRAGQLFAERMGNGNGPKVLMIGHLDTVFEADSPFQEFRRSGDLASGPGVADMKSGCVVLLYALKALDHAGLLNGLSIVVALTGEEESPGRPLSITRKDLVEAGQWSDLALGFEGGVREGDAEYATVARRGSTGWTLTVEGMTGHSSRIFNEEYGAGAIFEVARILNSFYEEVRGEEYLTFNAGVVLGGTEVSFDEETKTGTAFGKTNVIPQRVVVRGGIRTISPGQLEETRDRMREVVARSHPMTSATITFSDGYPPMAPGPENYVLLEKMSRVSQDLGFGPMEALDPGRRGAADISFVAPYTPGLAGMGPYGSGAHSPDETLDLTSVTRAAKRAAVLMTRLAQE
ncbi:MAG: M20/M25/M40 family metallo-hydrolase, partial [Gemmatimonadetes bacterium]|nr:M20/M25/M40 family metallo-hydrolase [Gemmatimonadota bacterium]